MYIRRCMHAELMTRNSDYTPLKVVQENTPRHGRQQNDTVTEIADVQRGQLQPVRGIRGGAAGGRRAEVDEAVVEVCDGQIASLARRERGACEACMRVLAERAKC